MSEIGSPTLAPAAQGAPSASRQNLARLLLERSRSLGLVGVLIVVWVVFDLLTGGVFLTPRNLTNLSVQVAITAMLAAGIVMLMVPGYIDLSIGAAVAFCAIIAAKASTVLQLPVVATILVTLIVGLIIGAWHGFWVARLRVPAFIVTLASLLAVRGLALLITQGETISPSPSMLFIANATIPVAAMAVVFAIGLVAYILGLVNERKARLAAGVESPMFATVTLPAIVLIVPSVAAVVAAGSYRGLPLPVGILLIFGVATAFILSRMTFGRHLYAMGGNAMAATLAGIASRRNTFVVFAGMGVLYGVAGLILVSRLFSAPPNAEEGLELNVIAAAVIGGTSLLGGVGTVTGALLGALLMESLSNGMSLMNLPTYYQQITVGLVLLLAVYFDIRTRGSSRRSA